MKKILISLSVFFIGFSFAANDTSSSISGSVNVPGATITVEHVPTGSTKSSAANDSGNFNFSGLRPGGPYVITASAAGFNTERVDNVYLTLAESNSFDVVLVSSTAIEDVVVTGVRSGISSSGPGSTITADDIALTASIDKGLGDFLKRDSRFSIQGTFRDVQISALGSNNRYNNFTIDGVAANDPLGLNANGFASVRNPISVETLAQIRVDFAPYSVTKGNFGGANINAVTKSGTNELKGKFYGYDTDQTNVGDVLGEPVSQFSDETKGFVVGGPIIEDKLFFFVGYEESERFSPNNSQPIAAEDEAELLQIKDFLMDRYNYDAGWPIFNTPPETQEQTLVKLDYTINENHRVEYIYQDTQDINYREYDRPASNYVFSAHYYVYPIDRQKNTFAYIGDISDDLSVEMKYTDIVYKNDQDPLGGENFGHHRIRLSSGEYAYPTGDQYRSANETNIDEQILNLKATLLRGNHTISVGYDMHEKFVSNLFIAYENGRWRWNSVDDFLNGNVTYMRFIKPVDGNLMTGAAVVDSDMSTFYVEDVVDVSDILTLNFGVRVDTIEQPTNTAGYNPAFEALAGFANNLPLDSRVIQPRFGYKLDIGGTKLISSMDRIEGAELSGGIGVFSGRVPTVWLTNPAANTGVATIFTSRGYDINLGTGDWRDYYDGLDLACLLPDAQPNENGPCADLSAYAGAGSAVANHPDFNVPSDLKMSMDLTLYLRGGARLTANYIKSEVMDAVDFTDLGVEASDVVQVAADGRTVYSEEYTQNIIMRNTSKGGMESFTLSIDKQFDNGVNAFASYTNVDSDSLWDGTSSRAQSNYRGTARADALSPSVGESLWNTDHRLIAGLDYVMNEGSRRATTFSLFWNAQSGRPYSYTWRRYSLFDYSNNVLAYIPAPGDPNVVYSGVEEGVVLQHIDDLGLSGYGGSIAPRNIGNADYYRSLDMRIAQEIPGFMDDDKFTIYFDAINILNYFNDTDGLRYFKYSTSEILETDGLDDQGRWIITGIRDDSSFIDRNTSSYRFQLGFSYEF